MGLAKENSQSALPCLCQQSPKLRRRRMATVHLRRESEKLNRLQNKALRAITGQFLSTPVEALRLEAGIQSYDTLSKRLLA